MAKWPAMSMPKGAKLDNEKSHAHLDPNKGGGPAAPVVRNFKSIPNAQRGGTGHDGRDRMAKRTPPLGGRGSSGNPASRGNLRPEGRQSFPSETRNPGHGGSPQVRDNMDTVSRRGGFGDPGQVGVPGVRSNPKPGPGNTSGRMARRITGRFNNASKGAGTGVKGSYGDRAPVTANT